MDMNEINLAQFEFRLCQRVPNRASLAFGFVYLFGQHIAEFFSHSDSMKSIFVQKKCLLEASVQLVTRSDADETEFFFY